MREARKKKKKNMDLEYAKGEENLTNHQLTDSLTCFNYQVIQAVTFSSPNVGGHLAFPKGHLTIPKRSPAELPGNGKLVVRVDGLGF